MAENSEEISDFETVLEERKKEFWKLWWRKDYSWEGLAKIKLTNTMTLQDYWRSEEDRLITGPDGRKWTRFHYPMANKDGIMFDNPIHPDQEGHSLSIWLGGIIDQNQEMMSKEIPICLEGVIIPEGFFFITIKDARRVRATSSWLKIQINSGSVIGVCDFSNSYLSPFNCSKVIFTESSNFSDAIIESDAGFDKCEFQDITFFNKSLHRNANFNASKFQKIMAPNAKFYGATSFRQVKFLEIADFMGTIFHQKVSFWNTIWNGIANFGSVIKPDSHTPCQFLNGVDFSGSTYNSKVSFYKCIFDGENINHNTKFNDSTFNEDADFNSVSLNTNTSFQSAVFKKTARFPAVEFSPDVNFSSMFENSVFEKLLDIEGTNFNHFEIFDNVQSINNIKLSEGTIFSEDLHNNAIVRCDARLKKQKEGIESGTNTSPKSPFSSLENGARVLKQIAERQRHNLMEQRFHRLELMARAKQPSKSKLTSRFANAVYAIASDYGSSIIRPLFILLCLFFIFAAIYFCLGMTLGTHTVWETLLASAEISLKNSFKPFWFLTIEPLSKDPLLYVPLQNGLFVSSNMVVVIVSIMIGIAQTFASIAMLFLSGLAIRRYFQMN